MSFARSRPASAAAVLLVVPACHVVFGIEGDRAYDEPGTGSTSGVGGSASTSAGATSTSTTTATSTAGGGGRDGGAGGAAGHGAGGDGSGGSRACPDLGPATDGPYGDAELYFGAPTTFQSLPQDYVSGGTQPAAQRSLGISGDGLVLASRETQNAPIVLRRRDDIRAPWESSLGYLSDPFTDTDPHFDADGRTLFACTSSEGICSVFRRSSPEGGFDSTLDPGEATFDFGPFFHEKHAAIDRSFVPTPDLVHLAFASSRSHDSTTSNDGGDGTGVTDLWMARAIDPADLSLGYTDLHHLDVASAAPNLPAVAQPKWPEEAPGWLADDGRTIVFHSGRSADFDLYVTSGDPETGSFGEAVRIDALSEEGFFEESFTMPSLATLALSCGRGEAYFRRFELNQFGGSASSVQRVTVCVGAPCD